MKKRILALVLALSSVMTSTAFAAKLEVDDRAEDSKSIVMCYDESGKLVYSNLYKLNGVGEFIVVPSEYDGMKKKVYFIDTKRFGEVEELTEEATPTPTPAAEPTKEPAAEPTEAPVATAKPTTKPSDGGNDWKAIYEKEIDSIFAPAVVKEVGIGTKDGEDIYAVTVFYQGEEITVGVEEELGIATAPDEYSSLVGEKMDVLQAGDVVVFTTNIAGDIIKTVDFIFRPTDEDIATGENDYGTHFEKLFASNGKVASKWTAMKYGEKASSDRYQYAFGIIGKKENNTLTLINKSGSEDEAIEIAFEQNTIVCACDVSGKELTLEVGDMADVMTTIPKSEFQKDGGAELTDDYSYNYALVRIVNDVATDIVVYNNYNE